MTFGSEAQGSRDSQVLEVFRSHTTSCRKGNEFGRLDLNFSQISGIWNVVSHTFFLSDILTLDPPMPGINSHVLDPN